MALSNILYYTIRQNFLHTQVTSNYSMYFTNYILCVPVWFTEVYMDTKNAFPNIPSKITTVI